MVTTPISGNTASDLAAAAQATAPQPQTTTTPAASVQQPTKIEPTVDTVKLPVSAEVRLLKTQGQTVAQIAVSTGLSAQAVNSYLGIAQIPLPTVAATKP
ncbi:MAG TPA: hypothetical protein VN948_10775 [Terriglobales bacterium]|nr:hypothetical protein [Terriglobales bacterium]